jgi:hypothetical protein
MADKEVGVQNIVDEAEISIVLDTYDDIFSDFDPRPYNVRTLSEDFLIEAKRAARQKRDEGIELRFIIPQDKKNASHEILIKQRLHEYFRTHHWAAQQELRKYRRQALMLIAIGTVIGFAAVWISLQEIADVFKHAVEILLSPASWFTIWTGLEHLTFPQEKSVQNEHFYRQMMDAHVTFTSY